MPSVNINKQKEDNMKKLITLIVAGGLLNGCGIEAKRYAVPQIGPAGPQGVAGPAGSAGVGSTGPIGPQGPQGNPGSSIIGPQGPAGSAGAAGKAGTNGLGYSPGLQCEVYSIKTADENGTVSWSKLFSDGTPEFSTVMLNFAVPNESSTTLFGSFTTAQQALVGYTDYALDCAGLLMVPETGNYTFQLGSDDGSELALDDAVVANMPQLQAYATQNTSLLNLFAGVHKINIIYFQGPPTAIGLTLEWDGPANEVSSSLSPIPASYYMH